MISTGSNLKAFTVIFLKIHQEFVAWEISHSSKNFTRIRRQLLELSIAKFDELPLAVVLKFL